MNNHVKNPHALNLRTFSLFCIHFLPPPYSQYAKAFSTHRLARERRYLKTHSPVPGAL